MSEANDGTGAGLLAFLDYAGSRGEIVRGTARAMAVATGKILAIEPDSDAVDVRKLDTDDLFSRFETLHRMDYTTSSMAVYGQRFRRAVAMYLAWLDKKPDWKNAWASTTAGATARAARDNGKPASRPAKKRTGSDASSATLAGTAHMTADVPSAPASTMVPYDLPLRPGLRVRLVLPELLTQADAKRIAAFVDSLAFAQDDPSREGG